jgi:glycosyltransferase involved in cell wall biosynthesis
VPARYSVVMTAYNEEEWIGDAVASVLAQTHRELELIVVDDGSSDGTVAALDAYRDDPRLRLIEQENAGLSAARNTGIEAGETEWVAFLDSDDLWMPNYLEVVDAALAERPDAGFAYVDAWRLDVNGLFFRDSAMARQNPPDEPPREPVEFLRMLIARGNFIFVSATARREALEKAGNFNTSLRSVEDMDLWIRILAAGYGGVRAGERLAIKRDRPTSMSGNAAKMAISLREVFTMVAAEYDVPDDVRASARKMAAQFDGNLQTIERGDAIKEARMRVRRAIGSLRQRALRNRIWYPETPPEIVAAFPQLAEPRIESAAGDAG